MTARNTAVQSRIVKATWSLFSVVLFGCTVVALLVVLTNHLALTFSSQDMLVSLGYGVLWCVGYLLTGLFEEILFRGYPLKRLTQGFGFVFAVRKEALS